MLGWQVRRLQKGNDFKVVAVAGSVGKTSTKLAIAQVLAQNHKVRYQDGNYNDLVSVPLIFFGQKLPNIFNPFAWLSVFAANEKIIGQKYPYDIVVVELGSDKPGDIAGFRKYIKADIGVLTGISPEHMEFFDDLDAVAREEMTLASLSKKMLINFDLCDLEYLKSLEGSYSSYGVKKPADYRVSNIEFSENSVDFMIMKGKDQLLKGEHESVSEPQLLSICAAAAVADWSGMGAEEIEKGIRSIKPVSGRMRRLAGINGSLLIDDSYNASPQAMKAALDTLYRLKEPKKIAVLGNMNELGGYSQKLHEEIGRYCEPAELELIVTIGPDANKYLSSAAKAKGCKVQMFDSPYSAGKFIKPLLDKDTAVLVKGSQNRVFAEEALKLLLQNPSDSQKLVRQSPKWLKIKHKQFSR